MLGAVVAAYIVAAWVIDADNPVTTDWFRPAHGVTVLAIFYVLAQAIERALLPIALLMPTTPPPGAQEDEKTSILGLEVTTRSQALRVRTAAVHACADTSTPAAGSQNAEEVARAQAEKAANWQEVLQQAYVNATTVWALGAAMAFLLCAWLDVYLLNSIAVEAWDPPIELDLLITGLAIGGGTVPLHDLIGRIQKKDDKQEANPPTGPTPGGGRAGVVVKPTKT